MPDDDHLFSGDPLTTEDELRRVRRAVHMIERSSPLLTDIAHVVNGLSILKRILPYVFILGVSLAAFVNKDMVLRWLQ